MQWLFFSQSLSKHECHKKSNDIQFSWWFYSNQIIWFSSLSNWLNLLSDLIVHEIIEFIKKKFSWITKSFFRSTQLSTKYVFHEIINLQYVIKAQQIFQLNITKAKFFKTIEQFLILKVDANKMKNFQDTSSHL